MHQFSMKPFRGPDILPYLRRIVAIGATFAQFGPSWQWWAFNRCEDVSECLSRRKVKALSQLPPNRLTETLRWHCCCFAAVDFALCALSGPFPSRAALLFIGKGRRPGAGFSTSCVPLLCLRTSLGRLMTDRALQSLCMFSPPPQLQHCVIHPCAGDIGFWGSLLVCVLWASLV